MHSLYFHCHVEDPVSSDVSSSTRWRTPADLHWGRGTGLSGLNIERRSSSWIKSRSNECRLSCARHVLKLYTMNVEICRAQDLIMPSSSDLAGVCSWCSAIDLEDIGVRSCGGIC